MDKNRTEYIPALKYGWLTSLYDPLLRWTMRESTFKKQMEVGTFDSFHME